MTNSLISLGFTTYCILALAFIAWTVRHCEIEEAKKKSVIINVSYILIALVNTHNMQKLFCYDWMDFIFYFLVITGSISRCYALSITCKKITNGKRQQPQRDFSLFSRESAKAFHQES